MNNSNQPKKLKFKVVKPKLFVLKETINTTNAKYLLSLAEDKLSIIIRNGNSDGWNGEKPFSNLYDYIKMLKKWLKKGINEMNDKGYIVTKYKFSKDLVSVGRQYVEKFGIQRLTCELRGFLCSETGVKDFDMKNAHPSILLNYMKKHFPNHQYKHLEEYVKNRSKYITEETTKKDYLISMNSNKSIKKNSQFFMKLDKEFKSIQKIFWNEYENKVDLPDVIKAHKNKLIQNKEGKFLNVILTMAENEIITKVANHFGDKAESLIFDGLHIKSDENNISIIKDMNKLTEEDGVIWDCKEFDKTIVLDEGVEITFEATPNYEDCKIQFEKNHFLIENPLLYGRTYTLHNEEKYQFYSKEKFRELVKPIKYFDNETCSDNEFFLSWIEDSKRRSYKEIKFIPSFENNQDIFNSFKGFCYEKDEFGSYNDETIEIFKNHLSLLTNHDENSVEYLIKYLAHLIQKPQEKPRVGLLFKSKQGYGKDTLMDLLDKLIGKCHIMRTADIDDVFGSYNVGIRDKLVMVLNELEGKNGYSHKEKIKNFITEDKTIIREKYITQYEQINYIRLIILTNNLNPIEVSYDDRRMVIFKAFHIKPNKEYFDKLHDVINSKEAVNDIFQYLANYDIEEFEPSKERPKTDAYNDMKEHNTNPIYKFINECFINNKYEDWFDTEVCKKHKKKNLFLVKSNNLISEYKKYLQYLELDFLNVNSKTIKSVLADIGVKRKTARINNTPNMYYEFLVDDLKSQLESMNLNEEIEEFNDDDFE